MKGACFFQQAFFFFENDMKNRLLIFFFSTIGFSLIGFLFYCFYLIEDISIKLEDVSKSNGGLRQARNFLEEGSVVDRKDIADYILFSE